MIATPTRQHDDEFMSLYRGLFEQLCIFASRKGIGKSRGMGATSRAEDPNDFAQACLIEYSESANRNGFQQVQIRLIWCIANKRMIDAHRLSKRFPRRDNFVVLQSAMIDSMRSKPPIASPRISLFLRIGLSAKTMDILRLKYVARYTVDEIAHTMQMKPSGVNAAVARARKRLLAIDLESDHPDSQTSVSKSS